MVSFPPCKINLGLNVIRKRTDGYHDIETCFYPLPWTDILEVIRSDSFQFTSSGIGIPGSEADNLCIKAYQLLKDAFSLTPVKIHLHKIIPMGAGLGGGSSDAAHTLRILSKIFELNLTPDELQQYAARLGSDCAFFIQDKPMIGSGRGEILTPTSSHLTGKFIVLVKPEVHVATSEAYRGIEPLVPPTSITEILNLPPVQWQEKLINDFEKTVFQKYPVIKKVKETFYRQGAVYASMSGSGSSVYAIFDDPVDLKSEFKSMTYWSGQLAM
jgi:4-diphosphocytidyl-2-C-methyl-D-erythritol kinase